MITDNRQRRWIACLMCVVLLVASFSTTVGAIAGAAAETDMTLVRFDWGILDPAYGGNTFAENELGHRVSEGFTISYAELAEAVSCPASDALVALIDESGVAAEHPDARVNAEGGITFQKQGTTGESVFRFTLESAGKVYGPATITVYTYGVSDSVFVLDYGLPVTMPMEQITQNDLLSLTPDTETDIIYHTNFAGQYGHFTATDGAIVYTPVAFMDGVDTLELTVRLSLPERAFSENVTGVTMKKSLKVVPANVVYYEDDFAGIRYVSTGDGANGNIWAVYEGDLKGTEQSVDQDMNYGSDPNYAANKTDIFGELPLTRLDGEGLVYDGELLSAVGDEIFKTVYRESFKNGTYTDKDITHALYGDASNDTIHAMAIKQPGAAELMSFTFTGTGFEIVGRTTQYAHAILTVAARNVETGKMTAFPVVTECASGDLCQVPFAARKGLPYGTYEVIVVGSNANRVDRMVYVDGVRVYQPLDPDSSAPSAYYKENESAAEFLEIKELIAGGSMAYGDIGRIEDYGSGDLDIMWSYGNTMIENFRTEDGFGDFTLVGCEGPEDYLEYGPNNEIYLSNASGATMSYIAFYVVLDEDYEGERSIQVGAHLKTTPEAFRNDNVIVDGNPEASVVLQSPVTQSVSLRYGNSANDFMRYDNIVTVSGGTEQYYTVDIDWRPINNNGIEQTLVVIGIDNAETNEILSLTNIKLNGYKVAGSLAAEISAVQDAYDINACTLMSQIVAIGHAWAPKA